MTLFFSLTEEITVSRLLKEALQMRRIREANSLMSYLRIMSVLNLLLVSIMGKTPQDFYKGIYFNMHRIRCFSFKSFYS